MGSFIEGTDVNFTITINGTAALVMHNGRLADRLDPAARALAAANAEAGRGSKRTEADDERIARVEFAGALYLDPDVGPYLPADNIWKTLHMAARKSSDGKQFEQAVAITSEINPVSYPGPRDLDGLYANKNFVFRKVVTVGRSRIARTRPIFQQWKTSADGLLDEELLDLSKLRTISERAGALIGLCEWRPRFGRFTATIEARQ